MGYPGLSRNPEVKNIGVVPPTQPGTILLEGTTPSPPPLNPHHHVPSSVFCLLWRQMAHRRDEQDGGAAFTFGGAVPAILAEHGPHCHLRGPRRWDEAGAMKQSGAGSDTPGIRLLVGGRGGPKSKICLHALNRKRLDISCFSKKCHLLAVRCGGGGVCLKVLAYCIVRIFLLHSAEQLCTRYRQEEMNVKY